MFVGNFPETQQSVTKFSRMTNHRETMLRSYPPQISTSVRVTSKFRPCVKRVYP